MINELSINGMLALKKLWSDARRQDWLVQKLGCGDFKGLTTRFRKSLLFSSSLDQEDKRRPCSRGVSDVKNGVLIFLARMFFRNDTFYVKTRLFLCGEIWVQSNLHVRPSFASDHDHLSNCSKHQKFPSNNPIVKTSRKRLRPLFSFFKFFLCFYFNLLWEPSWNYTDILT